MQRPAVPTRQMPSSVGGLRPLRLKHSLVSTPLQLALLVPVAYLLGSIPFGLIVGRLKGIDPRTAGSGNIGATNVARLLGRRYFAIVFSLDLLKGLLPVGAASLIVHAQGAASAGWDIHLLWLLAGFAAVAGHIFSIFLRFTGGKGVATSAGVVLGVWPYFTWPGLVALAVWGAVFGIFRYVSLASVCAAGVFPIAYLSIGLAAGWPVLGAQWPLLAFALLIAVMIIARHRTNLSRLREGREMRA